MNFANKRLVSVALITLSSTGLLTACSSSKDASPENFSKAIEQEIANSPTCPIGFFFPASMDVSSKGASTSNTKKGFEFLVKQGFLQAAETQASGIIGDYTRREFSLTPAGRENIQLGAVNPLDAITDTSAHVQRQMMGQLGAMPHKLCVAKGKKFVKIIKFNEPTEVNGVKKAQIAFTYKNENISAWVNTPEFAEAFPNTKMDKEFMAAATLKLNGDNWRVEEVVGHGF